LSLRAVVGGMAASVYLSCCASAARDRAAWIDPVVRVQAALDSIWVTLPGAAPLMAIWRGFIASGIPAAAR
jgi:hypothetical protein